MDRRGVELYRLSLFGRMIMGVAHEVDNHLSVVLGYSELAMIAPNNEKKIADNASKIFAAGEKISIIVRHFSRYVRPHEPVREVFTPQELLAEILPFSRYDLGRGNIALAWPSEAPAGAVVGDKRDLGLALLAVLFNGAEAMAGRGGALRLAVAREGTGWLFEVNDEGGGIAPEDLPRVFDEGFTRKPEGGVHGGMGLPAARHVLGEMGGTLSVGSAPGGGCAAAIRVPGR